MTYRLCYSSNQYDPSSGMNGYYYWKLNKYVAILSEMSFYKGDRVDIISISPDLSEVRVGISPVSSYDKTLVLLGTNIPLSEEADYRFECTGNSELILVKDIVDKGNKCYVILVGAEFNNKRTEHVLGTDRNTGDRMDFTLLENEFIVKSGSNG